MKTIACLILTVVPVLGQLDPPDPSDPAVPLMVNKHSTIEWVDHNPAGLVPSWVIFAVRGETNSISITTTETSVRAETLFGDREPGTWTVTIMPAGTDATEPCQSFMVTWLGRAFKLRCGGSASVVQDVQAIEPPMLHPVPPRRVRQPQP